ncbi:F-box only protein 9-like isoform X3 [Lingula anatina]|uniref:F-box only protein 9 n=1 Tax=Lingula anatina TaxID=7574 RepID=A0A1S3HIQ5_LINAN|nr:F-box only protein 9-like isoform X3 [Lingula anatina]|eukprot:XP_013384899.1 F-box only protein 9-like isoform X3 [Lingula anatina]
MDENAIRTAGSDSSSEDEEQEESEESSNIQDQLHKFRSQWQQELKKGQGQKGVRSGQGQDNGPGKKSTEDVNVNDFEKARRLFLVGVNAEKSGMLFEAVRYYRQAIQLVPDIEFRIEELRKNKVRKRERLQSSSSIGSASGQTEDEDEADLDDLVQHFQKLRVRRDVKNVCEAEYEQQRTHISVLPVEVLMYIFKWVVSDQLDMRSLEQLSMVCRGFYLCARDDELWRLASLRTWGLNCEHTDSEGSWRLLYLNKPHVHVHGCYISKTVYYRPGEPSLDSFYRPWHSVEYYRYARFFADGNMLLLTTADDPHTVLPKLVSKHYRTSGIMYGYYRLVGNKVTGVLRRSNNADTIVSKYRRRKQEAQQEHEERVFHVDFILRDRGGRHRNTQLVWEHYSVHSEDRSVHHEFDVNNENQYPNFYYSRVKSFTQSSNRPLE